jgi:hypothetical protein
LPLISLLALLAAPADAIPAFARKAGAQCSVCHDVYPKLNPFGRAFKEAGFVFPGEPVDWLKTIEKIPLSARTEIDITVRDDQSGEFFFTKPIVAGNLGNRISFWVDRVLGVFGTQPGEGTDLDFEDFGSDNAWVRLNAGPAFYVKGGKFELDLPYSSTRNYNLFTYEPWVTSSSGNATLLGVAQKGFELGGNHQRWRYSLAVVEGEDFERDDFDGDIYVRVARDIDVHRIGGFAYFGENTQEAFENQEFTNEFRRFGFDAEARVGRLDLHGVWMRATDDQPFPGAAEVSFNSGFVQGDVKLGALFQWTNRIGFVDFEDDPDGARTNYYLGLQHWALGLRMRLAIEYGWLEGSRPDTFQFAGTYVF